MQNNLITQPILTYDDLAKIAPGTSDEKLADVRAYDKSIVAQYNKLDMKSYTGDTILVRDSVAQKLAAVNQALQARGYTLKVVYGYRSLAVQEKYFTKRKQELAAEQPDMSDKDLNNYTHQFVAVPDVAGHPTGGAVDLTVLGGNGQELDMGTAIADYTDPEKIQTFGPGLLQTQQANRQLLHDLMTAQEFAPFYGEWWHFSYGDKEWAAFYNKKTALYGAITYKKSQVNVRVGAAFVGTNSTS